MTLGEAKALLDRCVRETLAVHAFGDAEVYWLNGDEEVAVGYFGATAREVEVGGYVFTGEDADALRQCGARGRVQRNDAGGAP
jgi:hypothetical protein